jgi:Mrp family chromosome partitioning ATPase
LATRTDAAPEPAASNRLLQGLKYHWFALVTLGPLVGGTLGVLTWSMFPAKYTSAVLLRVASSSEDDLVYNREGAFARTDFGTYIRTQAQLIRSNYVLTAAMRPDPKTGANIAGLPTFRDEADPIKWLETELKIEQQETSELLKITLEGVFPDDLKEILNAIQAAYMREIIEDELKRKGEKLKLLEELNGTLEGQLKTKKKTLKEQIESGGDYASLGEKRLSEELARKENQADALRRELSNAKLQYQKSNMRVEGVKNGTLLPEMGPAIPPTPAEEAAYQLTLREIDYCKNKIESYRWIIENPDKHPNIIRLREKLADAEKRAAAGPPQPKPAQMKNDPNARYRQEEMVLDATFHKWVVESLTSEHESVEQRIVILRGDLKTLAQKTEDQTGLAAEVSHRTQVVDRLGSKIQSMQIELKSPAKVKLLQSASAPIRKEGKKQIGMSVAAGLFGFGLVALVLLGLEFRARRVYGTGCIAAATPYGLTPRVFPVDARRLYRSVTAASQPALAQSGDPHEHSDATCELVARDLSDAEVRAVMLTSPAGEENHALLAVQLALNLQRSGLRTVLIDCNWPNPEVSALLQIADKPGTAEVLRGELPLQHAVVRTATNGLFVLPAGRRDAATADAVAAGKINHLLNELYRSFDLVLIDAPAAGTSVDAVLLTRASDAVLMTVQQFRSRLPNLGQALEQLALQGQREVRYVYLS